MLVAARLPVEIVSVDSAQVYRGMDIGTAKPSAAERAAAPHHLIDLIEPTETYSAGRFRSDAILTVEAILTRGKVPLLVGGTMLYYRAFAQGMDSLPEADASIRAALDAEALATCERIQVKHPAVQDGSPVDSKREINFSFINKG